MSYQQPPTDNDLQLMHDVYATTADGRSFGSAMVQLIEAEIGRRELMRAVAFGGGVDRDYADPPCKGSLT